MTTRQETTALIGVLVPLAVVVVILAAQGQTKVLQDAVITVALLTVCACMLRRL